jgi:hypothetical protein
MTADQAKALAKQHGPTAGIAVVAAVIAAQLASGDAPERTIKLPPEIEQAERKPRRGADKHVVTRLVSCGDSRQAKVSGDDLAGIVTLGAGAKGKCTVLFAGRWPESPTCSLNLGMWTASETELIATGVPKTFAYRCGGDK